MRLDAAKPDIFNECLQVNEIPFTILFTQPLFRVTFLASIFSYTWANILTVFHIKEILPFPIIAVPILNIESAPTKTPTQGETAPESGDTQPGQEAQLGNGWTFKQPGQFGVAGQPSETPPAATEPAPGQNMDGSPILLLRPPMQQPGGKFKYSNSCV